MNAAVATRVRPLTRLSVEQLGMAFIVLVGLVLRLVAIDDRGLWGDEAWRVYAARLPSVLDVIHAAWAQPPSAPLYYVGLHMWIVAFGHGDVAVRLFSVPASLGSLLATFWLGKLIGGRAVGLVAAGLLAVSPLAVEVGQEATMYAWSMLFATLTIASAVAWLKTGQGAARYVVCATLLLYTHYMGLLLLVELMVAGLAWWKWPRLWGPPPAAQRRSWLLGHGAILLLWMPWLAAMVLRIAERWNELSHLQHRAGLDELYKSATNLAVSASAVATWPQSRLAIVALLGGVLVGIGLFNTWLIQRRATWLIAALVLAFIGITIGTSAVTGAWLVQPRFLALVLPATLCVVAASAAFRQSTAPARSAGTRRQPAADRVLPTMVILLLGAWLVSQVAGVRAFYISPVHGRDGLREIAATLTSGVQPGDLVVANHALLPWFVAQYYDGPVRALPQDQDVRQGYQLWPPPDQLHLAGPQWGVLSQLAADSHPGRVWLLYLPAMDPDGSLLGLFKENYTQLQAHSYPLADLYLFAAK